MKPTLHLLMGLPGSGKTTLSKILEEQTGAKRISSDESRLSLFKNPVFDQKEHDELYAMLDHNVEHLLEAGESVIYDANLNRKQHRQEKYDLADKTGAAVILWRLTTPDELSRKRRLEEQDMKLVPKWEKPERMFERIQDVYEPPEDDEPNIAIDGTNIKKDVVIEKLHNSE